MDEAGRHHPLRRGKGAVTTPWRSVQDAKKANGIEPMKNIARSLRQHRELILNYFRAQKLLSSGVVEGLNNKAKVTMRKSYGFRTFRCLELALYHSLGKLPEPESTHEFF
jgi:transposase